ncbi:Cytochrome [Abeliophyllum distichum]|uniref:Cytochrome n=1 Tax=Abeliophyllum distichum TaxID=126358 RepID=A0ABD1Q815_9LAMI
MDFINFWIAFLFVGLTCFQFLRSNSRHRKLGKLPPGPYCFPIIGNIPQLSRNPHQSLAKLAKTYGPIMYLKLGSVDTIVVSSPEIAKEVLQHQALLGRRIPAAAEVHEHNTNSMAWLPMANHWRILRKISKEQVFSVPRLEASQGLRQEKLQKLFDYIHECIVNHQLVDVGEAAFITALNLMSATLFSVDCAQFNSDSTQELKETMRAMTKVVASFNLVDIFPVLKAIDPQRVMHKSNIYFGQIYSILDNMINQRLNLRAESSEYMEKNDFLEALLDYSQSNPSEFPRDRIKHLLLDLFVGGTDATAATVEWIMTDLIRSPEIMSKARNELWDVVGQNNKVKESDISRLPYLQSVIKETFRYHPTGPLLIPHKAEVDTEINGYIVPKNSQIFVNIWAIGRDSKIWSNPESFDPERFLKREIDIKGQDFDLIPFGSGKRMCPGFPLATRMVPLMVATMIQNFDWKPENGMKPEEVDISEKFGVALQKAVPLKAIPIKL